jgi:hypothetical protein
MIFLASIPLGSLVFATWPVARAGRRIIGAVAQLGERYNGIVEVRGSIPLGSTNLIEGLAGNG